jgi:putative membrane protein
MSMTPSHRFHLALYGSAVLLFIWSAIGPRDRFIWFLETIPVMGMLVALPLTYRRYRWTDLAYGLIWLMSVAIMVGGHYTFSHVPLFDWIRDAFGHARNNYDKLGHFLQGMGPFVLTREVLVRAAVLSSGRWLGFIASSIAVAASGVFEIVEWLAAELFGGAADDYLGFQGYIWDTQSDILMALLGAVTAAWTLTKIHDRHLERLRLRQTQS